jgi:hypothetical protein
MSYVSAISALGFETCCSVPTYQDEYLNLQDLRDIRRMNPTCAIKKSNIYNLISDTKAPEGRNIGNKSQIERNFKPQRGAILVLRTIIYPYYAPLGLRTHLVWHFYLYFAPLVRFRLA